MNAQKSPKSIIMKFSDPTDTEPLKAHFLMPDFIGQLARKSFITASLHISNVMEEYGIKNADYDFCVQDDTSQNPPSPKLILTIDFPDAQQDAQSVANIVNKATLISTSLQEMTEKLRYESTTPTLTQAASKIAKNFSKANPPKAKPVRSTPAPKPPAYHP